MRPGALKNKPVTLLMLAGQIFAQYFCNNRTSAVAASSASRAHAALGLVSKANHIYRTISVVISWLTRDVPRRTRARPCCYLDNSSAHLRKYIPCCWAYYALDSTERCPYMCVCSSSSIHKIASIVGTRQGDARCFQLDGLY